jgi:hypothetical protein
MKTDGLSIGRAFLEEIDKYIEKNLSNLTCDDIWKMYFEFFNDLKDFKGNSNGFTGLSEYLLFRSLYHLLGGSFSKTQITRDLYEFFQPNSNIKIGQATRVLVNRKRLYPDLAVWKDQELIAIGPIKIYLTKGSREIEDELKKLDHLQSHFRNLQVLLIMFMTVPNGGKVAKSLKEESNRRHWFNYLFLQGNSQLLTEALSKGLGLQRIIRSQ